MRDTKARLKGRSRHSAAWGFPALQDVTGLHQRIVLLSWARIWHILKGGGWASKGCVHGGAHRGEKNHRHVILTFNSVVHPYGGVCNEHGLKSVVNRGHPSPTFRTWRSIYYAWYLRSSAAHGEGSNLNGFKLGPVTREPGVWEWACPKNSRTGGRSQALLTSPEATT